MKANRINRVVILALFFLLGREMNAADRAAAERILSKYPAGVSVLKDLGPSGPFSNVKVVFLSSNEVIARAGHNGGGVKQDPVTKNYEILLRDDLPPSQVAQAMSHELSHVRDEVEMDKYLVDHDELNKIVPRVLQNLKGPSRDEFISKNREDVDFVLKAFFCTEARAYRVNKDLDKQGLPLDNAGVLASSAAYINENYIKKFGVSYANEAAQLEKDCLRASSYLEYVKSILPKRLRSQPIPDDWLESAP